MAVERNSDGSYDAVDSGGFGKDYHGQDVFGERIGGTGIGGNHFGGFEEGHFGVGDGRDHFEREATSYGDITQTEVPDTSAFEGEEEVGSAMRDSIRDLNSEINENSNTGSMDTSFQIGGTEEDKEKYKQELERADEELNRTNEWADKMNSALDKQSEDIDKVLEDLDNKSITGRIGNIVNNTADKVIDTLEALVKSFKYDDFDRNKIKEAYKEMGTEALRNAKEELIERERANVDKTVKGAQDKYDKIKSSLDSYESSFTDKTTTSKEKTAATPSEVMEESTSTKAKTKADMYSEAIRKAAANDKTVSEVLDMLGISNESSFTDKTKTSTTEAKPGTNMANAKTSPSDYLTKSNKDSTKEVPKEAPSRNDFGNHAVDTLKGVVDRVADNTTAEALGLKSIEEFARENGYNPNKLSTMKAYQSYQNKEIMKAIPGIVKQIGSYITERVKDAVDPSQLGERVRNTLARYNLATLIGAAILSISSGAGLQASIDQALTMVDTEDQPAVSDYLEDVLSDEGTVNDLKTAFDDALAPEQNSATNELDDSIVNIGRKDNTDYSGFNAGLGSSGTTSSDADVKVFIARNVKADPILRKMISKIGK